MPENLIEKLPVAKRQEVNNALLAGMSLRAVAKIAGCSHSQVAIYKTLIFGPALSTARRVNEIAGEGDRPVQAKEVNRALATIEPLRQRIESHRRVVDSKLQDTDAKGAAALISADLRGIELEAKLTGALEGQRLGSVTFQNVILMPKNPDIEEADACGAVVDSKPVIDVPPADSES